MPVITRNQRKTATIVTQSADMPKRSRRNIPRVNYAGMDTIEPESEFDGITNIWADLTIYEDPDYVFEEDV